MKIGDKIPNPEIEIQHYLQSLQEFYFGIWENGLF